MTLPAARSVVASSGDRSAADDRLRLDYHARHIRRRRVRTEGGLDMLIDLADTTSLEEGMILLLDDGRVIAVVAAAEPLTEVRAPDGALARLAWHIGNRHTPCEIRADRLLIQRDHVLEEMLRGLGAEIAHVETPFQPEGGAYGHGRTHSHAHAHDPHSDPNAHIPHRHDPA